MEFFCAMCQQRHKIGDISADIWKIIAEDVKAGVIAKLMEFVSGRDDADSFIFLYKTIENHLEELSKEGSFRKKFATAGNLRAPKSQYFSLSQTSEQSQMSTPLLTALRYSVPLGAVLDEVKRSITQSDTGSSDLQRLKLLEQKIQENRLFMVCRRDFLFYRAEVAGEYVLDKVTSPENDSFGGLGFERICPYCGQKLSRAAGFAEEIIIGLLGSPRAGKTSCLTALFSALLSNKYVKDGRPCFTCHRLEHDENYQMLLEEAAWYNKGYKVRKTDIISDRKKVFSYSLIVRIGGRMRVLTFIDIPGEFWQSGEQGINDQFYTLYAGIYENIDCIWFMMSKTTLTYTALDAAGRGALLAETSEDKSIIEGANPMYFSANLRQLKQHLAAHGKPFPPMAVIITKPDAAMADAAERKEVIERRLAYFTPSGTLESSEAEVSRLLLIENRTLTVDDAGLFQISRDVRKYLSYKSLPMFNAISENCEGTFFVSLSPYGHPAAERPEGIVAKDAEKERAPQPYREVIPLLWTMAICGTIDVRHSIRWVPHNIFGSVMAHKITEGKEKIHFHFKAHRAIKDQDKQQIWESIEANLMQRNDGYKQTQLNHTRG